MMKSVSKDNITICWYGVKDNYVWFKPTKYTTKYRMYILKGVKNEVKELLKTNKYLYTFSINENKLNKWHKFIGFTLQESFIFKDKQYNIWVI